MAMKKIENADLELLKAARLAAESRGAEEVRLLDLRKLSPLMDYFLICTANNPPHMAAVDEAVSEAVQGQGVRLRRREGKGESGWVILDFGGLVAHIFLAEMREFYDLDSRWADAFVLGGK